MSIVASGRGVGYKRVEGGRGRGVLESIFKPSILGPLKCVSYVRQTEVFLFCERLPKIISATNLLCASLKIITAIDLVLERCGIANMAMYHVTREVSGGEGLVLSMVLFELQGKKGGRRPLLGVDFDFIGVDFPVDFLTLTDFGFDLTFTYHTAKTTPRPEGSLRDKDLGGNIPPDDMEPIHTTVTDPSGTGAKYQVDQTQSTRLRYQSLTENKGEPSYEGEPDTQPLVLSTYADVIAFLLSDDEAQKSEEEILGADLKASIDGYYDENITHKDQTDKLLLKEINNAVKDDPAMNKKISEATESFSMISTNITELAAWAKSSTNMSWNLGSRISGLERAQNHIQSSIVTPTLSLTHIPANVEGKNATNTATEDPPSHTEGETDANKQEKPEEPKHSIDAYIKFIGSSTHQPPITQATPITIINPEPVVPQIEGKGMAFDEQANDQRTLVKASSIICPDPDEPVKVEFMINGKMVYLTKQEIQDYWDKEEQIKKVEKKARLLAISKPEVIKVVQEEAKKIVLDPKKIASAKAGEKFKKAQDSEHAVLKRQHIEKVRKSLELIKHKYDSYIWTVSSRLKPKPITDIKIHPKTKPVVITVYRGTDGINFDVHKPFSFGAFGISELYELREIIPRKKNAVSALPAPVPAPKQATSKSSKKKRKHMELESEIRIPRLECNRALPENVSFVNNMVIEELEYRIFFTDKFCDQSFQRWSDIDKVGMEALVSYLVAASMV
ncbi:hypothetical protein Tco_1215482 [Tanacetum coccineum]